MDIRRKNKIKMVMEIFINVSGMAVIFLAVWFIFYRYNLETSFLYKKGTAILAFIYSLLFFMLNQIYNGHKIDYLKHAEIIYSQILSMLFVNAIAFLQICLIDRQVVAFHPIVILCVADSAFIVWWTFWSMARHQKRSVVRDITVIYGDIEPYEVAEKIQNYEKKFEVKEIIKCENNIDKIMEKLDKNSGIILCGVEANAYKALINFCFENGMPILVVPDPSYVILRSAAVLNIADVPLFNCQKGELGLMDEIVKRSFDIVASLIAMIVFSPIMAITAILIKLFDGGPVIYSQDRLTINGKIFKVYKFRSMVVGAEEDGVARLAAQGDSRVTKIGSVIRKFRIDELPQLFNILKGDISVVGPRPERPEIAQQYEKEIPEFKFRLKIKAGLTGYAQVLGRYNTTPYNKLMWDLMYIEGYSFVGDMKIIMMTIKILFMPESSQGFEDNIIKKNYKKEGK